MPSVKYKRILIKFSGEILCGNQQWGYDYKILEQLATDITNISKLGVEIALVIGGGNIFRGKELAKKGLNRITSDHIGMLATIMNALAVRDFIEQNNQSTTIMSSIQMSGIVKHYDRRLAIKHLKTKDIVILCAGTGNPLFTTDSAACLRAIELESDIMIKATKVDGVYNKDPKMNKNSTKFDKISYKDVLVNDLKVIDSTALCLARDYALPITVFDTNQPKHLQAIVEGNNKIGTLISN